MKRARKNADVNFEITPIHSTPASPVKQHTDDWEISFLNSYQIVSDDDDDDDDNRISKKKKLSINSKNHQSDSSSNDDDNNRVVVLKPDEIQYFYGMCKLTVIHGSVEILGYHLDQSSNQSVKIYSFRGHSLLYIRNITQQIDDDNNKKKKQKIFINKIGNKKLSKPIIIKDNTAVLLCELIQETFINFIIKHISQKILPQEQITFQSHNDGGDSDWNLLKFHPDWQNLIDNQFLNNNDIKKSLKIMICGGKSTGKSTFLRYLINTFLNKYKKVYVIDLDPGQSEFTLPGCISILTIEQPIFGVNFTHLLTNIKNIKKSLLTQINISNEPELYLKQIQQLLLNEKFDNIPILINTMGYTHDIGINLIASIMWLIKPNNLIQINSCNNIKKNFQKRLITSVIEKNLQLFNKNIKQLDFSYNLYEIDAMNDDCNGWQFEARQIREMMILSYFSRTVNNDDDDLIYTEKQSLYEINLQNIGIVDWKGRRLHPAVVNANIVALCSKETIINDDESGDETIIFRCHGWGIVRGIDVEKNNLVLITPENLQDLQDNVKYLVVNGLTLPPSIYMTTSDDILNDTVNNNNANNVIIPYVNSGNLLYLGQLTKRSIVSSKKLKGRTYK